MKDRRCIKCEHWFGPDDSGIGNCQRHAPAPIPVGYEGPMTARAIWPLTGMDEFCGDFVALEGEE